MLRIISRKILMGLGMLLALSLLIFVLLRLTPGDPIDAYINPNVSMTQSDRQALKQQFGLDKPLPMQYMLWLKEAVKGNLGYSLQRYDQTVWGLIGQRIGPTLLLMFSGILLSIVFGVIAGIISAVKRNEVTDIALSTSAMLGISSPAFLTSLLGLFIFSVKLGWLPSGGMTTPGMAFSFIDVLHHLILPALVLSIAQGALIMRYMRGSMLEVLNQDYIRTARAKGVKEFWVIAKHCLRNALLPVVTLIGSIIGLSIGGAIFTESVFNWPGMGLLLVNAVDTRDYPVIMGSTLVIGACVILVNILTDLVYSIIDPRIQLNK